MSGKRKLRFEKGFIIAVAIMFAIIGGSIFYMARAGGGSLPVIGQGPNFVATDVNGKTVSFDSLNGKVRLITWFYTHCPGPCPLTSSHLEQIQNQLEKEGVFGSKVVIMSYSVDPDHDTLGALQKYGDHFHANYAGWYFLRATDAQTAQSLKAWGIEKQVVPGTVYVSHTIRTVLVDQDGNIRAVYSTDQLDNSQILSDVHSLLKRSLW